MSDRIWTPILGSHGEPLAVYIEGHEPLEEINYADEQKRISQVLGSLFDDPGVADEWLDEVEIEHFHIRDVFHAGYIDASQEHPWRHCTSNCYGAVAVTGVKFG